MKKPTVALTLSSCRRAQPTNRKRAGSSAAVLVLGRRLESFHQQARGVLLRACFFWYAEHVRQLGVESPLHDLIEVK